MFECSLMKQIEVSFQRTISNDRTLTDRRQKVVKSSNNTDNSNFYSPFLARVRTTRNHHAYTRYPSTLSSSAAGFCPPAFNLRHRQQEHSSSTSSSSSTSTSSTPPARPRRPPAGIFITRRRGRAAAMDQYRYYYCALFSS